MDDVWAAQDTTPDAIEAALSGLLETRHRASAAYVPARVLNLVAIVDADFKGEVENRLERVGRYHPSRLVICAVRPGRAKLSAVASVASDVDDPRPGDLALVRERVEIEIGRRHLRALDTIVDPLVVADLATVVWAPHGHDEGVDALRRLARVVLLDSHDEPAVHDALDRAADLSRYAYVVDLSWLRSTPWRERVAAAFDPPQIRRSLGELASVTVTHRHDSAASGLLFCGWLASRLGWRPEPLLPRGESLAGRLRARRGEVGVALKSVAMPTPGLCGIELSTASGDSLSLQRAPGGLRAVRRARDGSERTWTVLGASRGEGGILGEGVRQALLRDPTYRPALKSAGAMVN